MDLDLYLHLDLDLDLHLDLHLDWTRVQSSCWLIICSLSQPAQEFISFLSSKSSSTGQR